MMGGIFPFKPERGALKTFKMRLASLFQLDEIRVMQIMENIQYGLIYFFLGFAFGTLIDSAFPKFDEKAPVGDTVIQVILQAITVIIAVFYIKKVAKLIPFMFVLNWDLNGDGRVSTYKPYRAMEYDGNITIGLVLLASQFNFIKKIDLISREIYSRYMSLDKRIESIM
jgi:hypothetical protein